MDTLHCLLSPCLSIPTAKFTIPSMQNGIYENKS